MPYNIDSCGASREAGPASVVGDPRQLADSGQPLVLAGLVVRSCFSLSLSLSFSLSIYTYIDILCFFFICVCFLLKQTTTI